MKFVKEEFQPGHMVVYVKNTDYVPRSEPPSWASGGKVVRVDRAEWLYVPDAMTKAAALASGEADWWENPPPDIWPILAANPEIILAELDPLGPMGTLRFNHLQPPFDNVKMPRARPRRASGPRHSAPPSHRRYRDPPALGASEVINYTEARVPLDAGRVHRPRPPGLVDALGLRQPGQPARGLSRTCRQ